jgi:hypothetical protein
MPQNQMGSEHVILNNNILGNMGNVVQVCSRTSEDTCADYLSYDIVRSWEFEAAIEEAVRFPSIEQSRPPRPDSVILFSDLSDFDKIMGLVTLARSTRALKAFCALVFSPHVPSEVVVKFVRTIGTDILLFKGKVPTKSISPLASTHSPLVSLTDFDETHECQIRDVDDAKTILGSLGPFSALCCGPLTDVVYCSSFLHISEVIFAPSALIRNVPSSSSELKVDNEKIIIFVPPVQEFLDDVEAAWVAFRQFKTIRVFPTLPIDQRIPTALARSLLSAVDSVQIPAKYLTP